MKAFVVGAALLLAGLLSATATQAQSSASATPFSEGAPGAPKAPKKRKASEQDIARMQQRMNMNADEVKRDQQLEVLEARAGGSNSLTRGNSTERHYDRASGGFTVRRFRGNKLSSAMQKRGQTRPAPGIDPKGKPLKHKKPRKSFFSR